jgi:hypothetical protein
MITRATPGPIPIREVGWETRSIGELGNTPVPLSFASISATDAAYLYFKAETVEQRVEFTPLGSGPGTLLDYSTVPGWDGSKVISTQEIQMWNPIPAMPYVPDPPASSEAARLAIRGYDANTWTIPANPAEWPAQFGQLDAPGYWVGIGVGDYAFRTTLSVTDGTMRYNTTGNWENLKSFFIQDIQTKLEFWELRLGIWLVDEQSKPTPNTAKIADIIRQQEVQLKIAEQVLFQANNAVAKIEQIRDLFSTSENKDKASANLIAGETDAFFFWIAAEEDLEAFSAVAYPLETMREPFLDFVRWKQKARWLGWSRQFEPGIGILGARMSSSAMQALDSRGIPALTTAQLAFGLAFPFQAFSNVPAEAAEGFASVFELESPEYTLSISSQQVTSIIQTLIGPVSFGLSPEAANLGVINGLDIPSRAAAARIVGGGFLSGTGAGTCPIDNPNCDPYIIQFSEIFTNDGQPKPLNTDRARNADGDRAWAFQTTYVTYSGDPNGTADPTGLRALWQPVATVFQALNTSPLPDAVPCGTFQILDLNNRVMVSETLYTQPGTVGAVNMRFKVLTERS